MDWSGCTFVERVEGRCSGAPTVVGTRVFPEGIVASHRAGMSVEEIHEDFPTVSHEAIEGILLYAAQKEVRSAA